MNTALKTSWNILQLIFVLAATVFVALVILQQLSQQPRLKLNFKSFAVMSGSMEPTIMTGDVVFVRPSRNYGKDDIITYVSPEKHTVTHRIIDVNAASAGQIVFQTKGDNNHAKDPYTITGSAIIGKWWFTIPKLGYAQFYARTPTGIVIVVSLILGWIASDMVWNMLQRDTVVIATGEAPVDTTKRSRKT